MTKPAKSLCSHLFYQTRNQKPRVSHSQGVYLWDQHGNQYLDASSGAMVSNIGHSHPRVIDAIKKQLNQAAFAYRLHFENDAAEEFARDLSRVMPVGLNRFFLPLVVLRQLNLASNLPGSLLFHAVNHLDIK